MPRLQTKKHSPAETLQHFQSNPWTSSLIANPLYTSVPPATRILKPGNENSFVAVTLRTPETVPYLLILCLRQIPTPPLISSSQPAALRASPTPSNPTLLTLFTISPLGTSGWPNTAHGGFIATVLDESMSYLVGLLHTSHFSLHDQQYQEYLDPNHGSNLADDGVFVTATLEVRYLRPMGADGSYAIGSWAEGVDVGNGKSKEAGKARKKVWVRSRLFDEKGTVFAEGRGVWVETKAEVKL